MAESYDAIVVGGGHNGLVSAAYLARAGARTLVLESRATVGGAATTEAPWPDAPHLRVTRLSYVMSLMPPTIVNDLSLERHGYKVHPMGPVLPGLPRGRLAHDLRGRSGAHLRRDREVVEEGRRGVAEVERLARRPRRRDGPAADPGAADDRLAPPADLLDAAQLAWSQRGLDVRTTADVTRLMTMSIADLLDDWFESPQIKGAMAVNGVIGTWAGPCEPGTAYVMAHHSIGDVGDGQLGSWGYPEGGMGAVSAAIAASAREFGAEIRTNARVERLIVRDGRVHGAVLADGRRGPRAARRHDAAPEDRVPRPDAAQRAARRRSSPTSSAGRRAAAS